MGQKLTESDEGDVRGLQLGRAQGEALEAILRHMLDEVADCGAEVEASDYLIAYASEKAEGLYIGCDAALEWQPPQEENVHIEIVVRDRADGRFIPALNVSVTIIDAGGREIGTHPHPLLWHPYLYHYGRNWRIPGNGTYALRVRFPPPAFARHDRKNGCRLSEGADVTFQHVPLRVGREK